MHSIEDDHESLFSVSGKVIVITGATGILGAVYSKALAEAGATVIMTDLPARHPEYASTTLCKRKAVKTVGISCDLTNEQDVIDFFRRITNDYGKIDVILNNAAATGQHLQGNENAFNSFETSSLSVWEHIIKVNLTGVFLVAREGGKALKSSGNGSLINISSIYGLVGPDHRMYDNLPFCSIAAYAASKAGVHGFTKWLATYWGPLGVRVNTVVPGGVFANQPKTFVTRYEAKTPLGRMAHANDLVGIIVYLASNASRYCTGQQFIVDGGFTAW
jgi:NAD(P)-dependent dehydrogenase (short-subunit alcohol dehydrogenase family)